MWYGKDVFRATFCDDLSKKDEGTTGTKTLYWNNEGKFLFLFLFQTVVMENLGVTHTHTLL